MALNLPKIKSIFPTSIARGEGVNTKGQFEVKQIVSGTNDTTLGINNYLELPLWGIYDGNGGNGNRIGVDVEISNIKTYIANNNYTLAETTITFFTFSNDLNPIDIIEIASYAAGETGEKNYEQTVEIPEDGFVSIVVSSSNAGAGTAAGFYFTGIMNILR